VQVLDILVELKGAAQENDWRARMLDDLYAPWMGLAEPSEYWDVFAAPVSQIGLIKNGLKVNVPLLTDLLLDFLKFEGLVHFEEFDHQLLQKDSLEWKYKEERYRNIVFCEGFKGAGNPFLRSLRLTPLKGECLFIRSDNVPDFILQAGYSIVPWDKDKLWVGSNYNLKDAAMSVTEMEMKNQLEFVKHFLPAGWSLDRKEFGFRSTSPDRRPIIGPLPGYKGLYVFNGFGTKGASLIPYCLEMLLDSLVKGVEIDQEVSVSRFAAR
jgi:glycine/D-amino acid oxidase-like deaminating enzyme